MSVEFRCAGEQPDDCDAAAGVECGDDVEPPDPGADWAGLVAAREREGFDGACPVLVGLRVSDPDVGAVESVASDVAAFEPDEFAAPERSCVADEQ